MKTAAFLAFGAHRETSPGAILWLKGKESVDGAGAFVILSPVGVGSEFCEESGQDESLIVVEETESGSRVLS